MARSRIYRHDLSCPRCGSTGPPRTVIPGASRPAVPATATTARSTSSGNSHYFPQTLKRQAPDIYAEGSAIAAVGRVWD